jgi:hypothetical protein
VIAKIQPNKKEYKIILRLNDQKKRDWGATHTYLEVSSAKRAPTREVAQRQIIQEDISLIGSQ